MNHRLIVALGLIAIFGHSKGQIKINFHNSFGVNAVNLEDATGTPLFDDSLSPNTRQLVDWSRFYYNGEVQVFTEISENLDLGVGIGTNRLYYWEERFRNLFDTNFQFDYGTIWTFEIAAIANIRIEEWFIQSSASFHNFTTASGSTLGLAAGLGRNVALNDSFSIPILLKTDFVFGDGTTIAPNLGFGITYSL